MFAKFKIKRLKNNYFKLFLTIFAILIAGFLFFGNQKIAIAAWWNIPYSGMGESNPVLVQEAVSSSDPGACMSMNPATWIPCMLISVLSFAGLLLSAAGTLFGWIVNVDNFNSVVNNSVTYAIWTNVRDVLNIAFIMMLLFSAFCTIFQVEKYSYKKILLNLVIMALLVNFSFPITRFIIDIANSMMYTFIQTLFPNGGINSALAGFTGNANLAEGLAPQNISTYGLLAAIVFVFILAVSLLAVGVMLVIRMVALALLIIFSPIAFVASILPDTSSYSGQWWSNLFKYAFFGPIMIFVIYIATRMMSFSQANVLQGFVQSANTNSNDPNLVATMAYLSIPIVLLWLGMGIAQSMSIAGAGAVMGGAQKFLGWAGRMVKTGSITGLKAIDRNTLAKWGVSPRQFMKAWKQSTARAEEDKLAVGTGAWEDRINRILSFGREKTHYKEFAIESQIAKKEKELDLTTPDAASLIDVIQDAKKRKGIQSQYIVSAAMRKLAKSNDFNDAMDAKGLNTDSYGENGVREMLYKDLLGTGMGADEASRQLFLLGEIGYMKGNYGLYGMAKRSKDGKYAKNDDENHLAAAFAKMRNMDVQELMKKMHPNALYIQAGTDIKDAEGNLVTKKGDPAGLTRLGERFFKEIVTPALTKQLERSRPDFIETSHKAEKYIKKIISGTSATQAENIKEFIEKKSTLMSKKTKISNEFSGGSGI